VSTDDVPVFWHHSKAPSPIKYARTLAEMGFAVSLQPCPSCGERETPRSTMMGNGDRWTYVCDCARCGARRSHVFATRGDPGTAPRPRYHLGVGASEILTPQQFAAEINRLASSIAPDPAHLAGAAFRRSEAALDRTLTSALELEKFPDDQLVLPCAWAANARSLRQTVTDERARIEALFQKYVAEAEPALVRAAKAVSGASPAKLPATTALKLALAHGALAATQDTEALLADIAHVEDGDEKLAHAVTFATRGVLIDRLNAKIELAEDVAAARGRGLSVPVPPASPSDWNGWRATLDAAMSPYLNELGAHVRAIATTTFDLVRARNHLSRIAYLRAAAPGQSQLASSARQVSARAERARAELDDALDLLDVPAVQDMRHKLAAWAAEETRASMSANTRLDNLPFGSLVDSNDKLRQLLHDLAAALPA